MQKSCVKMLLLVPVFVLNACSKHNQDSTENQQNDTLVVIGVHDKTHSNTIVVTPEGSGIGIGSTSHTYYKDLRCVGKKGKEIELSFCATGNVKYIERGDTIVVSKGKFYERKFIANITQERLKNEFVNGR